MFWKFTSLPHGMQVWDLFYKYAYIAVLTYSNTYIYSYDLFLPVRIHPFERSHALGGCGLTSQFYPYSSVFSSISPKESVKWCLTRILMQFLIECSESLLLRTDLFSPRRTLLYRRHSIKGTPFSCTYCHSICTNYPICNLVTAMILRESSKRKVLMMPRNLVLRMWREVNNQTVALFTPQL